MAKLSTLSNNKHAQHVPCYNTIRALLDYHPDTGLFTWNRYRNRHGQVAGNWDSKYVRLKIEGKKYPAHRIAYYWMTGQWPFIDDNITIDHIDGDGFNNKWNNLRLATRSENQSNRAKMVNNTSGYKNISFRYNKYRVHLKFGEVVIDKYVNTLEEAIAEANKLRQMHHKEFNYKGDNDEVI